MSDNQLWKLKNQLEDDSVGLRLLTSLSHDCELEKLAIYVMYDYPARTYIDSVRIANNLLNRGFFIRFGRLVRKV